MTLTFDHLTPTLWSTHLSHRWCKFGENVSNTPQDIVLTMFQDANMDARDKNSMPPVEGGGIKNNYQVCTSFILKIHWHKKNAQKKLRELLALNKSDRLLRRAERAKCWHVKSWSNNDDGMVKWCLITETDGTIQRRCLKDMMGLCQQGEAYIWKKCCYRIVCLHVCMSTGRISSVKCELGAKFTRKPSWRKGYARQQCMYTAILDFWNSKVVPLVRPSPKTPP